MPRLMYELLLSHALLSDRGSCSQTTLRDYSRTETTISGIRRHTNCCKSNHSSCCRKCTLTAYISMHLSPRIPQNFHFLCCMVFEHETKCAKYSPLQMGLGVNDLIRIQISNHTFAFAKTNALVFRVTEASKTRC